MRKLVLLILACSFLLFVSTNVFAFSFSYDDWKPSNSPTVEKDPMSKLMQLFNIFDEVETVPIFVGVDDAVGSRWTTDFRNSLSASLRDSVGALFHHNRTNLRAKNEVSPVPEPASILLLGVGLVGIAGASRKKIFKTK